jgi:hypothetical protein
LWYNGNWNGSATILSSEQDIWVSDSRVYDDFLVSDWGWQVTTLFGDYLSSLTPSKGYWEIRSGVSAGNGGTLLYSGLSDLSWVLFGEGAFGYNQYRATVSGLDLTLSTGAYWMALAPVETAYGRAFLNGTGGANGVNALLDGNSYWDSHSFHKNFVSTSQQFGTSPDFAYGIDGRILSPVVETLTPSVETIAVVAPEPGSFLLMATGLALIALGFFRRRRPQKAPVGTEFSYSLISHSHLPLADGIVEAVLPEPRGAECPTRSSSPSLLPASPPSFGS